MTAVDNAIARAERSLRRAARRARPTPQTHTHWLSEVHPRSRGAYVSGWRHNLTTDTASGYTNRRDWQSKIMGGGFAPFATAVGNATATTATSMTNSGASFPTAGQGLAGCMVVVSANNSGVGATVWGIIVSNTGTALTVDQWYAGGTWATGTTPNATGNYIILPGNAPAMWLALSTDSGAPSSADTTLVSELSTGGLGRALATFAHTAAATTYTLQKVFNSTTTATINKEANFASGVLNQGAMPFESAEPNPPTLVSGDQLTQTQTTTIN